MTELLGAVLGLSFASGLNTYATVLALGVMQRTGMVQLPQGIDVVGSVPVIATAGFLYIVEFVADKAPLFDSVWDGIHTFIRPVAGALLAYGVAGNIDPQWQVVAALVGGGVALTSHTAKASTRAAVNVSPEPFSNWILSLGEDGLSFLLVWLTVSHPLIALAMVVILGIISIYIVLKFFHFIHWIFRRRDTT
jgi:hypothetical protein